MIEPFIILCTVTAGCLGGALPMSHKLVFGQTITGGLLASAPPGSHLIAARGMVGPIADRLISNATLIRDNIVDDFSCFGRTYGYYADQSNDCQVFHVCVPLKQLFPDFFDEDDINHFSFICPKYTVFSQDAMVCAWSNEALDCSVAHQLYHINSNFFVPKEEQFNKITTLRPNISPSKASTVIEVSPKEQRSNGRRLDANYSFRQKLINQKPETEDMEYDSKENFDNAFEMTTLLAHDDVFQETTVLPILQLDNTKPEVSISQPEKQPEKEGVYGVTLYRKRRPLDSKTDMQGSVIIGNQDIYHKSIEGTPTQQSVQEFENKDESISNGSELRSVNTFSGRHLNTEGNQIQDIVYTKDYFDKKTDGVDSNYSLHENTDIRQNFTESLNEKNPVNVTHSQREHSISTTHPSNPMKELSTTIRSRRPYRSSTPSPKISNRRRPSQIYRPIRIRIDNPRNNDPMFSSVLSSNLTNTTINSSKSYIQTTLKPLIFDSTQKAISSTTVQIPKTTSAISDNSNFRSYRFTAAPQEISQRRETYRFSRPHRYQNRVKQLLVHRRSTVPIPSTILTTSTETLPGTSRNISTSTAPTFKEITSQATAGTTSTTTVTTPATTQTTQGSYRFTAAPRPVEVTRSWMSFRASLRSRANYKYSRSNRYG